MINAFERKEDDNDNSFRNKPRSNVNPRNQKQRYNPQFWGWLSNLVLFLITVK